MLALVEVPWVHKGTTESRHEGALYAALAVIGSGNPELAQTLHDMRRPAPYAARLDRGLLRIGCLTTEVFLAVANSTVAYKAKRVCEDTHDTLLANAAADPFVHIRFLTPTSFGRSGSGQYLLPEPGRVFGSLMRRWRMYGGAEIPAMSEDEVTVVWHEMRTEKRIIHHSVRYGAVGTAIYRVPTAVARWYHTLAMYGEYAGVGQRTSQGFGHIKYDRSQIETRALSGSALRTDQRVSSA